METDKSLNSNLHSVRSDERFSHENNLDIKHNGFECFGRISDWSKSGVGLFLEASFDEEIEPEMEFHLHFMNNTYDEDEDGIPNVNVWIGSGLVRWVKPRENGIEIGIQFNEETEGPPLSDLSQDLTQENLFIYGYFQRPKPSFSRS